MSSIRRRSFQRLVNIVDQEETATIGVCHGFFRLWVDFESKKVKTESATPSSSTISHQELLPMKAGYLENPSLGKPAKVESPIIQPISQSIEDLSLPSPTSLKRPSSSMDPMPPENFSLVQSVIGIDDDLTNQADGLHSMNDYDQITRQSMDMMDAIPGMVNNEQLIFELQRQTVQHMMEELSNIGDILAATQLDLFTTQESVLSPRDELFNEILDQQEI